MSETDSTRDKVCPNCGTRYKWYDNECVECRVPLVEVPPDPADEAGVCVFKTDDGALVPLATMALDGEEIEYAIRTPGGVSLPRRQRVAEHTMGAPAEIWVRQSDANRARDLVADLAGAQPDPSPSWAKIQAAATRDELPAREALPSVDVLDAETGATIGRITEPQLDDLIELLEEPPSGEPAYYIDAATIEMIAGAASDPSLTTLLRTALGERSGMEIRCIRKRQDEN